MLFLSRIFPRTQLSMVRSSLSRSYSKRPPNPYLLFLSEFKSQCVESGMKDISALAGAKWRSMSDEERAPYVLEYQKARNDYLSNKYGDNSPAKKNVDSLPLSPVEKSTLADLSLKLREEKGKLSTLMLEQKHLQSKCNMPKNPLSIVGYYLSSSKKTVNDGIAKWANLPRHKLTKYYMEAYSVNSKRKVDLLKWKIDMISNNKKVIEELGKLDYEIREIELCVKKLRDEMKTFRTSLMAKYS